MLLGGAQHAKDRWAVGPHQGSPHPQASGPCSVRRWISPDAGVLVAVGQPDAAGSGRLPCVAMMQPPDFGNWHDPGPLGRLDRPPVWGILLEREVGPRAVIVRAVPGQDAVEVAFAPHEDLREALAADRADELFHEGSRPGALGGREHFADPHVLHASPDGEGVGLIAIPEEIGRGGVFGEDSHDLRGRPGRGGVLCDIEVDDAPALVGEHGEDEEDAPGRGGDREEIDGDQSRAALGELKTGADKAWSEFKAVFDNAISKFREPS